MPTELWLEKRTAVCVGNTDAKAGTQMVLCIFGEFADYEPAVATLRAACQSASQATRPLKWEPSPGFTWDEVKLPPDAKVAWAARREDPHGRDLHIAIQGNAFPRKPGEGPRWAVTAYLTRDAPPAHKGSGREQ